MAAYLLKSSVFYIEELLTARQTTPAPTPEIAKAELASAVAADGSIEGVEALLAERLAEVFPEDGRIHYQLALTCDALGLPQEARLHYSQARAARSRGG